MGQPIEGSNPSLSATALAGPPMTAMRGRRRPRGGGLLDRADVATRHRSIFDSAFPCRTVAARLTTVAARPETFAACGFSDLRAGFVLRDESSRRERSRAPRGSGCATREHDAGSPAAGTRPQPLEIPRSTNWARISEEPDAGTRADGVRHSPAQRRRPSRAPCYDPVAVLGGELAVPCTCNPL